MVNQMTHQPLLHLCVKLHPIVRSYTVITNAMHLLLHQIAIDNTLRMKSIMWTTCKMLFIPYQQSTCVNWSVFGTEIKTIHTVHHFLDRFSIFHFKIIKIVSNVWDMRQPISICFTEGVIFLWGISLHV